MLSFKKKRKHLTFTSCIFSTWRSLCWLDSIIELVSLSEISWAEQSSETRLTVFPTAEGLRSLVTILWSSINLCFPWPDKVLSYSKGFLRFCDPACCECTEVSQNECCRTGLWLFSLSWERPLKECLLMTSVLEVNLVFLSLTNAWCCTEWIFMMSLGFFHSLLTEDMVSPAVHLVKEFFSKEHWFKNQVDKIKIQV